MCSVRLTNVPHVWRRHCVTGLNAERDAGSAEASHKPSRSWLVQCPLWESTYAGSLTTSLPPGGTFESMSMNIPMSLCSQDGLFQIVILEIVQLVYASSWTNHTRVYYLFCMIRESVTSVAASLRIRATSLLEMDVVTLHWVHGKMLVILFRYQRLVDSKRSFYGKSISR
jgi:hypothetical protein